MNIDEIIEKVSRRTHSPRKGYRAEDNLKALDGILDTDSKSWLRSGYRLVSSIAVSVIVISVIAVTVSDIKISDLFGLRDKTEQIISNEYPGLHKNVWNFDNTELQDILNQISVYYNQKITLRNYDKGTSYVRARFSEEDEPENIIGVLMSACELDYHIEKDSDVIYVVIR